MNTPSPQLLAQPKDRPLKAPAAEERDTSQRGASNGIAAGLVLGAIGWICLVIGILQVI